MAAIPEGVVRNPLADTMAAEVKTKEIPEDMVIEILSRLPVKSLMRFRCVCKSWSRVFTNKDFIAKHHDNQNSLSKSYIIGEHGYCNRVCFSILSSEGVDEKFIIEETIHARYLNSVLSVDMLGPVNGLFALIPIFDHSNTDRIAIWNPATREFKKAHHPVVRFYCDDTFSFGFDRKSNDYKIVRFEKDKVIADLYSLNNDCWRAIDSPAIGFDLHKLVFHRGDAWTNYWWVESGDGEFVLSFNFEDEVFEKLFLLSSLSLSWYGYKHNRPLVTNFNKLLTLMVDNIESPKRYIDVWVMTEYGVKESWVKQMRLGPFPRDIEPLGFSKYGRLLLRKGERTESRPSRLLLWDPITGQHRNLHLRRYERKWICREESTRAVNYVESLVPINGQREDEEGYFVRTRSFKDFELNLK